MSSTVIYLLKDFRRRKEFGGHTHEHELQILLNTLTSEEKVYLANKFCMLEWSNQSLTILSVLQECRVLTATEYILSQNNVEHVQMVLSDFLEFAFELFLNFLQNCIFNSMNNVKLELILNDFFQRLLNDLLENPNIVSVNYLQKLKSPIFGEILTMVRLRHFRILFNTDKCDLREAFRNSKDWLDVISPNTTLSNILQQLVEDKKEALDIIFNACATPDFKGWKFFTILLHYLTRNCSGDIASLIKKNVRNLFKNFLTRCDERSCLELFIAARAVFNDRAPNLEPYNQWFKSSFGEMNYIISADKFKEVMSTLIHIVNLETENIYLQAQIATAIPAPALCNEIVLNYKRHCRVRLAELAMTKGIEKSIVVDDD